MHESSNGNRFSYSIIRLFACSFVPYQNNRIREQLNMRSFERIAYQFNDSVIRSFECSFVPHQNNRIREQLNMRSFERTSNTMNKKGSLQLEAFFYFPKLVILYLFQFRILDRRISAFACPVQHFGKRELVICARPVPDDIKPV